MSSSPEVPLEVAIAMGDFMHALAGHDAAQNLLLDAMLVAIAHQNPALIGEIDRHLVAMNPSARRHVREAQLHAFDEQVVEIRERLRTLRNV